MRGGEGRGGEIWSQRVFKKLSDPSGLSSSTSLPLDGMLVFRRFPPPHPAPVLPPLYVVGWSPTARSTLSKFCPSDHAMRYSGADLRQLLKTVFGFEIPF